MHEVDDSTPRYYYLGVLGDVWPEVAVTSPLDAELYLESDWAVWPCSVSAHYQDRLPQLACFGPSR